MYEEFLSKVSILGVCLPTRCARLGHTRAHRFRHALACADTHTCSHMQTCAHMCTHVHTHACLRACSAPPTHAHCACRRVGPRGHAHTHCRRLPLPLRAVCVHLSTIGAALPMLVCLEASHGPRCRVSLLTCLGVSSVGVPRSSHPGVCSIF